MNSEDQQVKHAFTYLHASTELSGIKDLALNFHSGSSLYIMAGTFSLGESLRVLHLHPPVQSFLGSIKPIP